MEEVFCVLIQPVARLRIDMFGRPGSTVRRGIQIAFGLEISGWQIGRLHGGHWSAMGPGCHPFLLAILIFGRWPRAVRDVLENRASRRRELAHSKFRRSRSRFTSAASVDGLDSAELRARECQCRPIRTHFADVASSEKDQDRLLYRGSSFSKNLISFLINAVTRCLARNTCPIFTPIVSATFCGGHCLMT